MTKKELAIVYKLRAIIQNMFNNECQDRNNPMRADKRKVFYQDGVNLADEIIEKYPPIKDKSQPKT